MTKGKTQNSQKGYYRRHRYTQILTIFFFFFENVKHRKIFNTGLKKFKQKYCRRGSQGQARQSVPQNIKDSENGGNQVP